jgi:lysophospholipase L1-like esterase
MRTPWALLLLLAGCGSDIDVSLPINPTVAGVGGVYLMGDSITYRWSGQGAGSYVNPTIYALMPGVIDAGVSGNTTCAMLERFEADVLQYKPATVVILGGTNDLLSGSTSTECLSQMADEAREAGAAVILGTIPPSPILDVALVTAWNAAVRALGYPVADYGAQSWALTDFEADAEHPSNAGYQDIMWPTLKKALAEL